jgi:putative toxin-antitoxin system antitoxin component (TIGR02293 family)
MKKIKKLEDHSQEKSLNNLNEPSSVYAKPLKNISIKEFTYEDFKKVADKIPFTQAEWSDILHISERTLQRYAKDNHLFAPINAERILLINKILTEAKITFGKTEKFYEWIKRNPYMMEGNLSVQSLSTYEGIQNVLTQLGRIQQGIFA